VSITNFLARSSPIHRWRLSAESLPHGCFERFPLTMWLPDVQFGDCGSCRAGRGRSFSLGSRTRGRYTTQNFRRCVVVFKEPIGVRVESALLFTQPARKPQWGPSSLDGTSLPADGASRLRLVPRGSTVRQFHKEGAPLSFFGINLGNQRFNNQPAPVWGSAATVEKSLQTISTDLARCGSGSRWGRTSGSDRSAFSPKIKRALFDFSTRRL